jgi:hypothetical protein
MSLFQAKPLPKQTGQIKIFTDSELLYSVEITVKENAIAQDVMK